MYLGTAQVSATAEVKKITNAFCRVAQEDMEKNRLGLEWRDYCSALLIPLNKCRRDNLYLPWKCDHERHEYEKCQYIQYKSRLLNPEKH